MQTITRLTITMAATQTVAWPHYAGSTLRGAFGRALRKAACITRQDSCTGCPLRSSCAYGVVFDPAAPAQPLHPSFKDGLPRYLVQAPALGACQLTAGQTQSFALLLMPGTQAHHDLVKHAVRSAIETELFKPGLFELLHTQSKQDAAPAIDAVPNASVTPGQGTLGQVTLRWLTPLRLQQQGKPVFKPQQLDAPGLLRALQRRQLQWFQLSGHPAPAPDTQAQTAAANACTLDTHQLQWHDIQRHSGTQNQTLPLGGLIGGATLSGPSLALHQLLPLLQLGEQLHVGKETVMGLGRYSLGSMHTA
jgi:hypothetical protein